MAGYDQVDPLIQWFLAGSGTCGAQATGISDDDRYGLDLQNAGSGGQSFRATSGNNSYQLRVNNSGITMVGGLNVTGTTTFASPVVMQSTLSVTGAATFSTGVVMQSTLTVTGGVVFRDSLVVTGTASFIGNVTVGDSLTVDNDVTVSSGLTVDGDITLGASSSSTLTVNAFASFTHDVFVGNDTSDSLLVRGGTNGLQLSYDASATTGRFSLGTSNATDPVLLFKDHTGAETFQVGNQSSTYQAIVTGDLRVTDDAYIAGDLCGGNVIAGATAVSAGEELRVVGQSRLEGSLTVTTGGATFTGSSYFNDGVTFNNDITFQNSADIILGSTCRIDFDDGSAAGFTASGWSGYVTARHDGNSIYIPYLSTAP